MQIKENRVGKRRDSHFKWPWPDGKKTSRKKGRFEERHEVMIYDVSQISE